MQIKYLDQDLRQRLDSGVVFYRGIPYIYSLRDEAGVARLYSLKNSSEFITVHPKDPEIDIRSPKIGFVNYKGRAYYLTRYPHRMYKQSFCLRSVRALDVAANIEITTPMNLQSGPIHNMLIDEYPRISTAMKDLEGGAKSVAISKDIAIGRDDLDNIKAWYKNQPFGIKVVGSRFTVLKYENYFKHNPKITQILEELNGAV